VPEPQEIPSPFPVGGVDVSCEFSRQPPGTAADAENVRSFDTLEDRMRGGSRPGLSKFIDERVNGVSVIQHLAVLVDPTTLALSASSIPYTVGGTETGPASQGSKLYRRGGSGAQPAVSLAAGSISLEAQPANPAPGAAPAFVAGEAQGFSDVTGQQCDFVFTTNPTVGNLVVFFVAQLSQDGDDPGTVLVTNGNSEVLDRAGSRRWFAKTGANGFLTCYYRTYAEVADRTCSVSFRSAGETLLIAGLEYSGVVTTSPLGRWGGADDGDLDVMTAGTVTPGGANEMIVAAFMAANSPDTVTAGAGFTLRVNHPDGSVDNTDIQLYVIDRADSDFPTVYEPTADFAGGADRYCAALACFKD
jgi:hypothetical protein